MRKTIAIVGISVVLTAVSVGCRGKGSERQTTPGRITVELLKGTQNADVYVSGKYLIAGEIVSAGDAERVLRQVREGVINRPAAPVERGAVFVELTADDAEPWSSIEPAVEAVVGAFIQRVKMVSSRGTATLDFPGACRGFPPPETQPEPVFLRVGPVESVCCYCVGKDAPRNPLINLGDDLKRLRGSPGFSETTALVSFEYRTRWVDIVEVVRTLRENGFSDIGLMANTGGSNYPPATAMNSGPREDPGLEQWGLGPVSSRFFGRGDRDSHHIVYVVDRSGSMIDTFDYVRQEMLTSISKLRPEQDFHVVMFGSVFPSSEKELKELKDWGLNLKTTTTAGAPIENGPEKLVSASKENKTKVAEFLSQVRPHGKTDPISALKRAFDVPDNGDKTRPGKIIYLLTDDVFPDSAAVLAVIKERNKDKDVRIFTFLYGNKPAPAVEVMEKIAKENGGQYKFVAVED